MSQQRIKLFVTEVGEPQSIGDKGAKKLVIKAKNPEDKILSYFTFNQKLFPHIKAETEIDVDVDITQREYQGDTYTDRKIVQIYSGSEPVTGKAGGGGGWRGKSPEEIELERYKNRSIEAQTCLKEAIVMSNNETITVNNWDLFIDNHVLLIARKFLSFIDEAHGIKTEPQKPSPKPAESTTPPTETQEPPKQTPSSSPEASELLEEHLSDNGDLKPMIDMAWFNEMLDKFAAAGIKKWSKAMTLKALNTMTGRSDKVISEAVKYLTKEQADAITISILETEKML